MALAATTTLRVEADAHVSDAAPTTNYGSATSLKMDNSPRTVAYVRFAVDSLPAGSTATLKIYANTSHASGFDVRPLADPAAGWSETTISAGDAPVLSPTVLGSSGPLTARQWVSVDVTGAVAANAALTLGLVTSSDSSMLVASREAGTLRAAQLVITSSDGGTPAQCSDGIDNDGDGKIDYPLDLGCASATDETESPDPPPAAQCSDGIDNDGDGKIDYPLDLGCTSATDETESPDPVPPGVESTLTADADAHVSQAALTTNYGSATSLKVEGSPEIVAYVRFSVGSLAAPVGDATLRVFANTSHATGFAVHPLANPESAWDQATITAANAPAVSPTVLGSSGPLSRKQWVSVPLTGEVAANRSVTLALMTSSPSSLLVASREAGTLRAPQLVITSSDGGTPAQCSDGIDNDGDGTVDYPSDQGCASASDDSESSDPPPAAQCSDGIDNDGDGKIDYPLDLGCASATDETESPDPLDGDAVVTVGGDTADGGQQAATAQRVVDIDPVVALTTGDNADGTLSDFQTEYDPTWGRFKAKTRPAAGNHEYGVADAAGYFDYFNGVGAADGPAGPRGKGYYSFDLGSWHVIVLNSEIDMSSGSPQETWLGGDLAANAKTCTLAVWHRPRFTSGSVHRNSTATGPLWQALYDHNADVVINGHNHQYERFAPMNPSGAADPARGIREFVAGTGGGDLYGFSTIQPNSEVHDNTTAGVLKLTLRSDSYDWQFVPAGVGSFTDSGTTSCH